MLNRRTLKKLAMSKLVRHRLAWCGLWLAPWVLATPCQAGPWFDSLFGITPRDPAAVARTSYSNPAAANCNNCGQGNCQQTVVQYLPQVAYRTVWEPIPVTTYRRTVNYNTPNGLPMTCTQPCTSYTYQARRVPYTTFRPVYAQVPVPTAPAYTAPAPAPVMAPAATPNCNCNTGAAPAGYTTAAMAYPPTTYTASNQAAAAYAAPAYSTPSYSTPGYAAPSYAAASAPAPTSYAQANPPGATAWEPVNSSTASSYGAPTPAPSVAPPAGSYGAPNPYGASGDEADRKPRIDPSVQPPATGITLQRIPPGSAPANSGISSTRGFDSPSNLNGPAASAPPAGNPASLDPYYQRSTDWTPLPRSTGSAIPGLGASDGRFTSEDPSAAGASGPSTAKFDLQPIPNSDPSAPSLNAPNPAALNSAPPIDPYAPVERSERRYQVPQIPSLPPANDPGQDAPPLLNEPRDRTARMQSMPTRPIPTRWKANRIHWTASHQTPAAERLVSHEASLDGNLDADRAADRMVERASLERDADAAPRSSGGRRLDATRVRDTAPVTMQRFQSDAAPSDPQSNASSPNSTPWRSVR